ncbi:MAG: hypothetical protein AAFY26_00835 [Cyanobacteria bacterium J06638_22]
MKKKVGAKRTKIISHGKQKNVCLRAFEDFCTLETFVDFQYKGRKVGAALLQSGKQDLCFVFGFTTEGIHDTLRADQIGPTKATLEAGLKELLPGERMTIHLTSFRGDDDRQASLDQLIDTTESDELQLLLMSEKVRSRELYTSGLRRPKTLTIYTTVTISRGNQTRADADWIEKVLAKLSSASSGFWESMQGEKESAETQRFEALLERVFKESYLRWEHLLNIKMGLEIKPLKAQQVWERVWHRFNDCPAPTVPQRILFTDHGVSEDIQSEIHPVTLLIAGKSGTSAVPEANREWIKAKDKYIGLLTFVDKPAGFANGRAQLRYLWEVICRPQNFDCEVICQISAANPHIIKTNVQRILKQSNVAAQGAVEKSSVDVVAMVKTKRSVQVQEQLYEGAIPVNVGTAILVHRDTLHQLDAACSALSDCFQLPARVVRETEITWQYWLQTLPISWERLLSKPFGRTMTYLTNEAPGLLPVTKTRTVSRKGFELIADEGSSPVLLDIIHEHRNMAVFGTTRSGKSVIVSGLLTQALAEGLPIVALDYPKPDGTSTFSDYTKFLKDRGAYFDVGRESNNLMEMPNLSNLEPEQANERFEDYKAFLESAIVQMVLPSQIQDNALLEQTVRSLIGRALTKFFDDPDIQQRYREAETQGFGSDAWSHIPTLQDFERFCSLEALELEDEEGLIRHAQSQITLQLDYWLNSRIGKAIARPSSFPTDAQLLVFALRNLSNESEAAILSLSAYSAALRRALQAPKSIFFIDESPILFAFSTIARLIGRLCANGAKAGIRVILSAQDPDTIMNSVAGQQIFQNMNTRLIGRIQPMATESFCKLLSYPREIISRNSSESFFPKRSELYSNWLLDIDGNIIFCRYYPSAVQLAAVANNPDEQEARDRVMRLYPQDHLKGMATFSKLYFNAIRGGTDLDDIGAEASQRVVRFPSTDSSLTGGTVCTQT